ncbi:MAG: DNA polymerase III subunit delta [Candidatus Cloacimonadota bacterium]|nr:DNA polymerase III subunit delta [Candidatus Cloacimonadota bacterium]
MAVAKKLKYFDLVREIESGRIHPLYFFSQDESLLKDKAFRLLKQKIIDPRYEAFNYFVFHGEETNASQIIQELQNPPVVSEKKLIIVRNFDKLHFQYQQKVVNFVEKPIPDLVFVLETGKVDMRKAVFKKLTKIAASYYFYHAYNEIAASNFLRQEVRKHHKNISPSAVRLMIRYIGLNLQEINNELEKLLLYVSNKNQIALDDVQNCVGAFKGNTVFELQDAIVHKNVKYAIQILENLLSHGQSGVFILIMLTRFFKTMWKISILKYQQNKHIREIEKTLWVYNKKNLINQATRFQLDDFPLIFNLLLEADKKLKSINLKPKIIMELMVYKICKNIKG